MTGAKPSSGRIILFAGIFSAIVLVIGANAHLVYVSVTSQPECVPHTKAGQSASPASFSAARSVCQPDSTDR